MFKFLSLLLISTTAFAYTPVVKDIDRVNSPGGTLTLSALPSGISYSNSGVMGAATITAPLVFGAGALSIPVATNAVDGYLSAADHALFSATGANAITSLTGDITASGPGAAASTLATVNGSPGSFAYASLTVNGKGLVTAASNGTAPVTSVTGTAPVVSSGGTTPAISMPVATTSVNGYLSSTDWNTFNGKQSTLTPGHDFWIDRNGSDSNNCSIAAPCQTVGYALTLVSAPSSTNNYTIHLLSGRHDQEVNDLLMTPYTFIVGNGGPDVGSYLRLPAGKAIKLGAGWTSNARGGIQSVYLGGGTSVNLDFAAVGGAAGSTFMFDDVFVTGTFNHTGRGVNGGDFLYMQNSFMFGAATLVSDELQSINSTWGSSITATTASNVNLDATMLGGSVGGAFSLTQSGSAVVNMTSTGTSYISTFTTVGTIGLAIDNNLPIGYTLSGGTTRTNTNNSFSLAYAPTTSADWNTVPTLDGRALDTLASSGIVKSQSQNLVLASPNGSSGLPSFRALTAADLPAGTTYTFFQETASGTVNNSNTAFTLAHAPAVNAALILSQDGLILIQGTDYTIAGTAITMTVAPNFGQTLYATYSY